MNFFETFPECSLLSTVSKKAIKMIGHHSCLRDLMGQSYTIYACTRANHASYYSTNCNTIQIWSWCSRYLSFVGNRYPAIFSVFMWRNHIPKSNITFPSEVLVLSDKRPYRNLTFHNVLARQCSSYYIEACRSLGRSAFEFLSFCVTWHENCDPRRLSRRSKDELSLQFLLTEQCLH